MAKSAEEKAAIRAEREAEKAERRAEKDQIVNLKSAQQAEIMAYREALSDSGMSDKEIKGYLREEKLANKDELRGAKDTLAEDGLQYIGYSATRPDGSVVRGPILSGMDTIEEQYQDPINEDIRGALSFYRDYNLPRLTSRGNVDIGVGIDDILKVEYSRDPETGEYTKTGNLAKVLDRAQEYVHNTFTAEDLMERGARLKQDKNNPDLYTWKFGNDESKGYLFFKDNGDGTFTGVGANRMTIDAPDSGPLGGLFKAVPFLPELAAVGTAMIPGGQAYAGQVYAAGKGLQTAAGGGDLGDILKSYGLSYLGSNVLPGVVGEVLPADIASIPGVTQGVSRTSMGVLSGQDIDDAIMAGITSGAGKFVGSEISDITGSPEIGKVSGALTSTALSGGDVGKALESAVTTQAIQSGLNQFGPSFMDSISDPSIRRIAENSLSKIVQQGMSGAPSRPSAPTPIPGVVRRQFQPTSGLAPEQPETGAQSAPPRKRDVSELKPYRVGGLSVVRRKT